MPRPDRAFRTPAIILKRRDFGEADRLLTILTPEHGKLDVIAKGARKPTSHKTGHVELFTRADMLIHRGRDLDIAVQAEMTAPYLGIRENLQRGAYASYIAELLDRFTIEGDEDYGAIFELVDQTLYRLCHDDDPRLAVRYYEMRLLDEVGFRPELTECVISREPIEPEDQFFSYAMGGVIKPQYGHEGTALVTIPLTTLKVLRHMQRSPYSHVKTLTISLALHDDLERILLSYITYLLERSLQSIDFIRRIRQS
ncbi:MAG TPA: DNA repair protein RecO [Phototrophicaceae bacterium]|nr:DNA repair protein RecO [Phototrophicaceae bacterium]